MDSLATGCHGLDRLLGGGFPIGHICLIYGEASTGKTILAMQCSLEAARKGSKIFYLDADQSFSPNRVQRLVDREELAEQIILFRPEEFREQTRIVENLENMLTKTPTLLVIDSITGLYRALEDRSERFFNRDRELNRELAHLGALTTHHRIWVLLTGQVHSSPSRGHWIIEPVATRTLKHWSDLILRLRQTPRRGVRECIVEKRKGIEVSGTHCLFEITEKGIKDV